MVSWIGALFGQGRNARRKTLKSADQLLAAILGQARQPIFYQNGGVADTVTGRFDLIVLHSILVMRAIQRDPALAELNQAFLNALFQTIDDSFREMGVADMRVPKKVRQAAEAFYGRLNSYEEAFSKGSFEALEAALLRNVYADEDPGTGVVHDLAVYVIGSMALLAITDTAVLKAGKPQFAPARFGKSGTGKSKGKKSK